MQAFLLVTLEMEVVLVDCGMWWSLPKFNILSSPPLILS